MFKRRQKSPTSRTEAEETADDLRRAIREKLTLLEQLQSDYNATAHALPLDPETIVANHIRQLKAYNDVRDVGIDLVRRVAAIRDVDQAVIFNEMGLSRLLDDA